MKRKYLSRKFILSLLIVISATWLVWNKSIADGVYSAVVIAVIGAYIAGNVGQRYIDVNAVNSNQSSV
jgi:hypothetical protein